MPYDSCIALTKYHNQDTEDMNDVQPAAPVPPPAGAIPFPRLTDDLPGIGGEIRRLHEDFQVEEIPLYEASGEGTHNYLWVEKRGISSMELVHRMARTLGRDSREIGLAGLKDARAVTRQWISIEHVEPQKLAGLKGDGWQVLDVRQHRNKLKIGHLSGNRFRILIRDAAPGAAATARAVIDRLHAQGVPNIFGRQRFGFRGDTHLMGMALLKGNAREFCDQLLGRPQPTDPPAARRFRVFYDVGKYHESRATLPPGHREHKAVLDGLMRARGDFRKAMQALPKNMKKFFISAWQSALFNQLLARRNPGLGIMMQGDLAWLHDRGAVFPVEDLAAEQPRADSFEISPTGPLFGYRMSQPTGEPGRMEAEILSGSGISADDLHRGGSDNLKGGRRPLRVPLADAAVEECRDGLWLTFVLPSGCYATTVLDEVMKVGLVDEGGSLPEE